MGVEVVDLTDAEGREKSKLLRGVGAKKKICYAQVQCRQGFADVRLQ